MYVHATSLTPDFCVSKENRAFVFKSKTKGNVLRAVSLAEPRFSLVRVGFPFKDVFWQLVSIVLNALNDFSYLIAPNAPNYIDNRLRDARHSV